MISEKQLSRVVILIEQQRFSEAEKELSNLLAQDANNVQLLSLLSEVYLQQDFLDKAETTIDIAIGLSPDESHLFYIKARIAVQQESLDKAEKFIKQGIELYPYDADYFALLANIRLARKQFEEALEFADRALEIDAENVLALNTRSTALNKLNREEESYQTIEGALREDPNNAFTHANYGWVLLEKGQHKKALEHFKESLSQNPTFEFAQMGMLEAIKASNPIYRIFLKYSFWMGNLTAKYQWAVIIGFYVGFRGLRALANNNEALQPYLTPLIFALAIIAFSTWIINPIGNLFLRFNKYGKLLLSKEDKKSSNFVALSLGVFLTGLILYLVLSEEKYLAITAFGFAMMLPLSVMFSPSKHKHSLLIYAIALAVLGTISIAITFSNGILINRITVFFLFGFIGFQWVANYLMIKEDNQ